MFSLASAAYAQSTMLRGKVTDASTGEPLIGVNIIVKGTVNGTITDMDGDYSINLQDEGATLVFSSVGYESMEVVSTGAVLDVQLIVKSEGLDEVVVVGYGTSKARDLTGSVSSVRADDLEDNPTVNGITIKEVAKISPVCGMVTITNPPAAFQFPTPFWSSFSVIAKCVPSAGKISVNLFL